MLGGGSGREEQSIGAKQFTYGSSLSPFPNPKLDLVFASMEQECRSALWIPVRPLLDEPRVVEDEAIPKTDSLEHKVELESRRNVAGRGIQEEGPSWHASCRITRTKGMKDVRPHVIHDSEHVRLPRRVRSEQPSHWQNTDRLTTLSPYERTNDILLGQARRKQGEREVLTERSHVRRVEGQQGGRTTGYIAIHHMPIVA